MRPLTVPLLGAGRTPAPHPASSPRSLVLLVAVALAVLAVLATPGAAAAAAPGEQLWWDSVFNVGGSGDETAVAVAADASAYPVVAGSGVTSAAADRDIRYRSYDLTGLLRWNAVGTTWPDPSVAGRDDQAAGIVVDDARNAVYVAGTTETAATGNDIVLLRVLDIDAGGPFSGDLVWSRAYNAAASRDDEAEAVALDKQGNVYVTGGTQRANGSMDVLTVKFRPSGAVAWARRFNNGATRLDRGLAIAVRGSAVYVAGISARKSHGDDLVLLRYSLGGKRAWVRFYDDPKHRHESLSGIAAASGAVYLSGSGRSRNVGGGDALLVKYRADGKRLWARYAGGRNAFDAWADVAVDPRGRPHVTGFLHRKATGNDVVTRVYRPTGKLLWQAGFSSTGSGADIGSALAVDGSSRTYVCGSLTRALGDVDGVVLAYSAKGAPLWTTTYPDTTTYPAQTDAGNDVFTDIIVAGPFVYVVGRQDVSHAGATDADMVTLAIQK